MAEEKRAQISQLFLFVSAFLVQAIMGMIGIAVPIYANFLGASPFLLGIIGGAGGLVYSFLPLVFGTLSDRFRRKWFIIASMCLCSLSCLLYHISDDPAEIAIIKVLESTSVAAFWPAIEALIADTDEKNLEKFLRKFNISWGTAMIVGPAIGGGLISAYSFKAPFLVALVISLFIGSASPALINELKKGSSNVEKGKQSPLGKNDVKLSSALLAIFLFSSLGGMAASLFPAYATNLGIPAYEVGLIMLVWGVARVITFYNSSKVEKRLSKKGMFIAGSSILAIASFLIANSSMFLSFAICFLIFGFGSGILYSASISSILRRWSFSRGYAAGLFESLIGVGYFLGPIIGGAVSTYGANAPYIFGSLLAFSALSIQLILNMKPKRKESEI